MSSHTIRRNSVWCLQGCTFSSLWVSQEMLLSLGWEGARWDLLQELHLAGVTGGSHGWVHLLKQSYTDRWWLRAVRELTGCFSFLHFPHLKNLIWSLFLRAWSYRRLGSCSLWTSVTDHVVKDEEVPSSSKSLHPSHCCPRSLCISFPLLPLLGR